jgi:hypothetical protein
MCREHDLMLQRLHLGEKEGHQPFLSRLTDDL